MPRAGETQNQEFENLRLENRLLQRDIADIRQELDFMKNGIDHLLTELRGQSLILNGQRHQVRNHTELIQLSFHALKLNDDGIASEYRTNSCSLGC